MLDKRFRWASDGRIVLLVVLISLQVFNLVLCAAVGESSVFLCHPPSGWHFWFSIVSTIVSLFLFSMVTPFQRRSHGCWEDAYTIIPMLGWRAGIRTTAHLCSPVFFTIVLSFPHCMHSALSASAIKIPLIPHLLSSFLLPYWTCYGFGHLGHSISLIVVTDCPHSIWYPDDRSTSKLRPKRCVTIIGPWYGRFAVHNSHLPHFTRIWCGWESDRDRISNWSVCTATSVFFFQPPCR